MTFLALSDRYFVLDRKLLMGRFTIRNSELILAMPVSIYANRKGCFRE
jgi:hypothetical protein